MITMVTMGVTMGTDFFVTNLYDPKQKGCLPA